MEEAADVGCNRLLQLVPRGACNYTGRDHWNCRVAVGTGGAETERHPFDAPGDGFRVERADLGGLDYPQKSAGTGWRNPARILLADRGRRSSDCHSYGSSGRIPQRCEWTRIGVSRTTGTGDSLTGFS